MVAKVTVPDSTWPHFPKPYQPAITTSASFDSNSKRILEPQTFTVITVANQEVSLTSATSATFVAAFAVSSRS